MKKIFIIVIIVLGIFSLGLGVYFAWKKSKQILTPPVFNQPQTSNHQPLPPLAEQKLKILSDQPIFDYWIMNGATSSRIFYLTQDGKIFEAKEKEDEAITSEPIEDLQLIKSSSDGKYVLIKFGDLFNPQFTIFNAETKIFQSLDNGIMTAAFSPDAKKIAYFKNNDLMIKDLIGRRPKTIKIFSFNQNNFNLEWPSLDKIVLIAKPSALYPGSALLFNIKNKTLVPIALEQNGLMINWSKSGEQGLEFISRDKGLEDSLSLINQAGQTQANLQFLTLPNKCLIAEPKIYCAVPQTIPFKTILPDDYLKRAVYFKDSIYQIDINQNSLSEVLTNSASAIDAFHLSLLNNQLLFINRYDNRLYSLTL